MYAQCLLQKEKNFGVHDGQYDEGQDVLHDQDHHREAVEMDRGGELLSANLNCMCYRVSYQKLDLKAYLE